MLRGRPLNFIRLPKIKLTNYGMLEPVLRIRIRKILGPPDLESDLLVEGTDPDPFSIKQK